MVLFSAISFGWTDLESFHARDAFSFGDFLSVDTSGVTSDAFYTNVPGWMDGQGRSSANHALEKIPRLHRKAQSYIHRKMETFMKSFILSRAFICRVMAIGLCVYEVGVMYSKR